MSSSPPRAKHGLLKHAELAFRCSMRPFVAHASTDAWHIGRRPHGRSAAQLDRAMDVGVELFPGCEVAADGVALPRPVGTVYPRVAKLVQGIGDHPGHPVDRHAGSSE